MLEKLRVRRDVVKNKVVVLAKGSVEKLQEVYGE